MFKTSPTPRQAIAPYFVWAMRVLFLLLLVIIIWKSIEPPQGRQSIPNMDKVLHFGAYAVLCFVAIQAKLIKSDVVILSVVIAIGILMEIMQGLMGFGRTASVADLVANTSGALLSFWICRRLKKPGALGE